MPSIGIGAATEVPDDDALIGSLGGHIVLAHQSGHGVRVGLVATFSEMPVNLTLAERQSFSADVGYVHRLRLVGDDRRGLGLDLGAGISVGNASDDGDSCWGCTTARPDPNRVASGAYLGGNAGVSLDVRLSAFLVGLDVRTRLMGALEHAGATSSSVQLEMLAAVHIGFGFY